MNIMPNKTPDVWAQIWDFLSFHFANHNQLICGVVIAFFASLLNSFLHGKPDTIKRVAAEAMLCGLLAGVARPILIWIEWDIQLITPIGAAIGLAGTSAIRRLILFFFKRKAGEHEQL